jgi:hypothetical protein
MMATSFGALCTDFYVNQKLALKMDLPSDRETILHMFDRVRKTIPSMDRFRRYDGELALESVRRDPEYAWMALRRTSIRTGHVNPASMAEAYRLHRLILEVAPYHLTISPLDVDYVELMYGFDLECRGDHDEVVFEALFADGPVANLMTGSHTRVVDVQPVFGLSLSKKGDLQAYFEVKTRHRNRRGFSGSRFRNEPISILLTVRKYGPIDQIDDLKGIFDLLAHHVETLAAERAVPNLVAPIARQITSSSP